jgi:predicted DNA-binding protein (MmcQ/YjbR family)
MPAKKKKQTGLRAKLLEYALSFPEAYEDHPWGESVAKVGGKVFVFLGHEDHAESGVSLKLASSHGQAMTIRGIEPTGYGLGRSGWVNIPFKGRTVPIAVLRDWIDESYRLVAPKKLVAKLDADTV